ncbi:MAG: VOC family protein [Acidimicrobiia bacterium]|nr:VOC family protein [Acidimicrobiia bacterium]
MAVRIQVVVDCHDPAGLGRFWAEALGYEEEAPPPGFDDWPAFLRSIGVSQADSDKYSAVVDPEGTGPRVFFERVPEDKVVKNRVHLDLSVGGGRGASDEERRQNVARGVARLEGLGATVVGPKEEMGVYWVVMQDPEGNEFCLD